MKKINLIKIKPIKLIDKKISERNIERQFRIAKEIVFREDRKLLKKLSKY